MTTVNTPGISWGLPQPANPSKKPNNESFYLCELKWNGWHCQPSIVLHEKSTQAFCTKLIPVPTYVPSILEKTYVSYHVTRSQVYFNNQTK
jgi:hypothetical protein